MKCYTKKWLANIILFKKAIIIAKKKKSQNLMIFNKKSQINF
jgi:hypothetical protein